MTDYASFLEAGRVAIFLFHGVIREKRHVIRNYTQKHLLLDRFVAVLRELRDAGGVPVSMDEIVAARRSGRSLPSRAFAITFDDGFENNLSVAAPVLVEHGIPATFYVTTRFVAENGSSWIDLCEAAVDARSSFVLQAFSPELDGAYARRDEKISLLERIRRLVKNDRSIDPYAFAARFREALGAGALEPDPDLDRKMTWAELRTLAAERSFTVGGHGHTHRILEFLDDAELEDEVVLSLAKLRGHLGTRVEHYSYPEGLAHCYSPRVIAVLERHGIVCSPTAEHGTNGSGEDLFHLKRIMVA